MNTVILDTNVIVIANGQAPQASADCVRRCRQRLALILSGSEKVVLDYGQRILQEYRRNLRGERHPRRGRGDLFLQWLRQNQWNEERCSLVHITPLTGNGNDFAEFPNEDTALATFHKKDRKFIAVACAYRQTSGHAATILLAIDRGWLDFVGALTAHEVAIDFLCERDIQQPRQDELRN